MSITAKRSNHYIILTNKKHIGECQHHQLMGNDDKCDKPSRQVTYINYYFQVTYDLCWKHSLSIPISLKGTCEASVKDKNGELKSCKICAYKCITPEGKVGFRCSRHGFKSPPPLQMFYDNGFQGCNIDPTQVKPQRVKKIKDSSDSDEKDESSVIEKVSELDIKEEGYSGPPPVVKQKRTRKPKVKKEEQPHGEDPELCDQ